MKCWILRPKLRLNERSDEILKISDLRNLDYNTLFNIPDDVKFTHFKSKSSNFHTQMEKRNRMKNLMEFLKSVIRKYRDRSFSFWSEINTAHFKNEIEVSCPNRNRWKGWENSRNQRFQKKQLISIFCSTFQVHFSFLFQEWTSGLLDSILGWIEHRLRFSKSATQITPRFDRFSFSG